MSDQNAHAQTQSLWKPTPRAAAEARLEKPVRRPLALSLRQPPFAGELADPYAAAAEPPREIPVIRLAEQAALEHTQPDQEALHLRPRPVRNADKPRHPLQGLNTEALALRASLNKLPRPAGQAPDSLSFTAQAAEPLSLQAAAAADEPAGDADSAEDDKRQPLSARQVIDKWEQKKDKLRRQFSDQVHERSLSVQKDPHAVVMAIMKRMLDAESGDQGLSVETRQPAAAPHQGLLTVAEAMSGDSLVCVFETISVEQLAGVFNRLRISAIPMLDSQSREFLGLITMEDIFSRAFSEKMLASLHLGATEADSLSLLQRPAIEFMEPEPVQVGPDCPVEAACELMLAHRIHHLAVTEDRQLKGVFSSFDGLALLETQCKKSRQASDSPRKASQRRKASAHKGQDAA